MESFTFVDEHWNYRPVEEALRSARLKAVEERERLRAALQQARKYVDGTLGPERPVAVAEIDRALEGMSDGLDELEEERS